jgi:hypothetical protein
MVVISGKVPKELEPLGQLSFNCPFGRKSASDILACFSQGQRADFWRGSWAVSPARMPGKR